MKLFSFLFSLMMLGILAFPAWAAHVKPVGSANVSVTVAGQPAPAHTLQTPEPQDTGFFALYNGSGWVWAHEVKKTLLVISFMLVFVVFMGVKFYIDTRGQH